MEKLKLLLPDSNKEFDQYLLLLDSLQEENENVVQEWLRLFLVMIDGVDLETRSLLKNLIMEVREASENSIDETLFDVL